MRNPADGNCAGPRRLPRRLTRNCESLMSISSPPDRLRIERNGTRYAIRYRQCRALAPTRSAARTLPAAGNNPAGWVAVGAGVLSLPPRGPEVSQAAGPLSKAPRSVAALALSAKRASMANDVQQFDVEKQRRVGRNRAGG